MKISKIEVSVVNVPFVAPIRWSGGANADWTRLVIQMHTDDGLIGLGETLGGEVTKALIETEIAAMFLGEDPFDLERILSKATFVPLYYGKCGHCAIAGLELACWDLMGKAVGQPLCQLLGGRLREEIPFAAYLYHRLPDAQRATARSTRPTRSWPMPAALDREPRFRHDQVQGRRQDAGGGDRDPAGAARRLPDGEAALRSASDLFARDLDPHRQEDRAARPRILRGSLLGQRRHGPGARSASTSPWPPTCASSISTAWRWASAWARSTSSWATSSNGAGSRAIKKLQGACEVFQLNLNFHSAGEIGIGTAAYLHLAASVPALPHALDTHVLELAGDVVKPGVIRLTERGTMPVPDGPGPRRRARSRQIRRRHRGP